MTKMGTFHGLYFRGVMVAANIAKIFPARNFLRLWYIHTLYWMSSLFHVQKIIILLHYNIQMH